MRGWGEAELKILEENLKMGEVPAFYEAQNASPIFPSKMNVLKLLRCVA